MKRKYKSSRKFLSDTLLILLMVISSLLCHSTNIHASPAQKGAQLFTTGNTTESLKAGQLLLQHSGAKINTTAVMLNSAVDFNISGMLANVSLRQTFKNQSSAWVEAVYVFPLPEKAAVKHLKITIGDRVIVGQVKEKSSARRMYQAASASGQKAGLVEQQRPNMFTARITNIAPDESITVELIYLQTLNYDNGYFSLRFPMTITPRYNPGMPLAAALPNNPMDTDADRFSLNEDPLNEIGLQVDTLLGWALNTVHVPDASLISPFINPTPATASRLTNPITITATIDMGMALQRVDSAYHDILVSKKDTRYELQLKRGQVSMTQDFVINWRPEPAKEPVAALFSESLDGEEYLMLMLVPPVSKASDLYAATEPSSGLPREVVFIIDTSSSMDGAPIRQAKQSLLLAVNTLRARDRFNIIEFNSKTTAIFNASVVANRTNIERAKRHINSIRSGGGTEMLPALQRALQQQGAENSVRQVIFITDGAVGNEQQLFQLLNKNMGSSRLFTVGIGSAPNSYFMRKAAQLGKGTFTHIGDTVEIQQVMTELFNQLDSPQMTDIVIQWPGLDAVEMYPNNIPDLYAGEPLILKAKVKSLAGSVSISGKRHNSRWNQIIDIEHNASQSGIATLWAREKISRLLDEKIAGREADKVRSDVLKVALQHQLVSPYSSFVAVDQHISRPDNAGLRLAAVTNARPKGQGPQAFAYPNTATRGRQSLLVGIGLLLLSSVLLFRRQLLAFRLN